MSCYFIGMINFIEGNSREEYNEYVSLARPIIKKHQGIYLARTDRVQSLLSVMQPVNEDDQRNGDRNKDNDLVDKDFTLPDKVILIKFPDREHLKACFGSAEYQAIMGKRIKYVRSKGIVVGGYGDED